MSFDAVAYINTPRWRAQRLGLERIRALLDAMGRPQDRLRFVHVVGTNGKGSTSSFLADIVSCAGMRCGLFTSPYIEQFEERIRVDGTCISPEELVEVTLFVKRHAEEIERETGEHPTEFELMCAVAFEYFARRECDLAVLEAGLGGRLDATNVIDAPDVCVCCRIGLDHTEYLGCNLHDIATEKAAVIKLGTEVVSWPQKPEAADVIQKAAKKAGARLSIPDFKDIENKGMERFGSAGDVRKANDFASLVAGLGGKPADPDKDAGVIFRRFTYAGLDLRTRLLGSYQPQNAALAIEAAYALGRRGLAIDNEAICRGIARTYLPGRFEVLSAQAGLPVTVLDGGHNVLGARALVATLQDLFPGSKPVFIVGMLEEKDYPHMIETIAPYAAGYVCITPPHERACPADRLLRYVRQIEQDAAGAACRIAAIVADSTEDALEKATRLAQKTAQTSDNTAKGIDASGIVCCFGSLYSIASLRAAYTRLLSVCLSD